MRERERERGEYERVFTLVCEFLPGLDSALRHVSANGDGHHTSKIARPVSPGLKSTLGISPQMAYSEPRLSTSAPKGTSHLASPASMRRTAGSTIQTSTTFDRPFTQRRVPYKPVTVAEEKSAEGNKNEKDKASTQEVEGDKIPNGNHIQENGIDTDTKLRGSMLARSTSRLPSSSLVSETHQAAPGRSQTLPEMSVNKLAGGVVKGDAHKEPTANESRLKYLAGGRGTPAARTLSETGRSTPTSGRSGLARPTSRLAKPSQLASKEKEPVDGGQENGTTPTSSGGGVSKLKLERKGSGGVAKRHGVDTGMSSLPRSLSRGAVSASGSGLTPPSGHVGQRHHGGSSNPAVAPRANGDNSEEGRASQVVSSSGSESKGESAPEHPSPGAEQRTSADSGEQRRMLRRPGTNLGTTGIRTPNMPSGPASMPVNSGTTSEERSDAMVTPAPAEPTTPGRLAASQLPKSSASTTGLKYPGDRKIPLPGAKAPHHPRMLPSNLRNKFGGKPRDSLSSSSDSLDSSTSSDIKATDSPTIENGHVVESKRDGARISPTKTSPRVPPPLILRAPRRSSLDNGDILSPPADFSGKSISGKEFSKLEASSSSVTPPKKEDPVRYGRRISPEGMSHEEIAVDPKEDDGVGKETESPVSAGSIDKKSELGLLVQAASGDVKTEVQGEKELESPKVKLADKASTSPKIVIPVEQTSRLRDSPHESAVSPTKAVDKHEEKLTRSEDVTSSRAHHSRVEQLAMSPIHSKRSRSLSPSSSRRISPAKVVLDDSPLLSDTPSSPTEKRKRELTSSDFSKSLGSSGAKQLKSSMRNGSKSRDSSSSSLDSTKSPKVTISPRSSRLVYLPDEIGLQPAPSHGLKSHLSPRHVSPLPLDRSQSFFDRENSRGADLLRRASIRSTMSEKLDYRDEIGFLEAGLERMAGDQFGSTPEVRPMGGGH